MSKTTENGLPAREEDKPASYRVLTIDADQSVSSVIHIQAADDVSAKAIAQRLSTECAIELWDGLRFIEHFEPAIQPNYSARLSASQSASQPPETSTDPRSRRPYIHGDEYSATTDTSAKPTGKKVKPRASDEQIKRFHDYCDKLGTNGGETVAKMFEQIVPPKSPKRKG